MFGQPVGMWNYHVPAGFFAKISISTGENMV